MNLSLKSIWNYECPRCRTAKIFTEPFEITDPLAMPKRCAHCDLNFEPEPGFYYGAMFLSYILSSFFLLLPTLFFIFYFKWSVAAAMSLTIFLGAFTYFRFLRMSRSLWLHLNVDHVPPKID